MKQHCDHIATQVSIKDVATLRFVKVAHRVHVCLCILYSICKYMHTGDIYACMVEVFPI